MKKARTARAVDVVVHPDAVAEPLFTLENGTYMTRNRVITVLRSCLLSFGIDPSLFGTHSFGVGGCVAASAAGYDAAFIQLPGSHCPGLKRVT